MRRAENVVAAVFPNAIRPGGTAMECTIRSPSPARRAPPRSVQLVIVAASLCFFASAAIAATSGSGMPWEAPLDQLLQSLSGPVARAIGGVAIIGLGIGLAFSEGGSTMRKALWVVIGLALAFNALTWGLSFLGFSGGLCV
ncbi:MAG: TrbC/VirB2 family protein [Polyangiaceae bacterium]